MIRVLRERLAGAQSWRGRLLEWLVFWGWVRESVQCRLVPICMFLWGEAFNPDLWCKTSCANPGRPWQPWQPWPMGHPGPCTGFSLPGKALDPTAATSLYNTCIRKEGSETKRQKSQVLFIRIRSVA